MTQRLIRAIRDIYRTDNAIPLHAPVFVGNEKQYVADAVQSTIVSSIGKYVDLLEQDVARYTGSEAAVAVVNGTAALHLSLLLAGVGPGDLVLCQPLTFIATCAAIRYCGAEPIFIDVDRSTLGLSPKALVDWLNENAVLDDDGICRVRSDRRPIRTCVPMHTFGHPVDLDGLLKVCTDWRIGLIEDAAEALGSLYKGKHVGTFGFAGTLSFNGNKIMTTGGGGMVLSNSKTGRRAKHLTTTAKVPHPLFFVHDEVGFNYRMPNLNAALGCGQLELLETFVAAKRKTAEIYKQTLSGTDLEFVSEPDGARSNYWLNAIICQDQAHRDVILKETNDSLINTRPAWNLMHHLPMFEMSIRGPLPTAEWLQQRLVNLPSSVPTLFSSDGVHSSALIS